jgi:hypothetical protein
MGVVGFPVIMNDRPAGQEGWNGTDTRRNQDASIARRAVVGGLGDNRNWLLVRAVARDH